MYTIFDLLEIGCYTLHGIEEKPNAGCKKPYSWFLLFCGGIVKWLAVEFNYVKRFSAQMRGK